MDPKELLPELRTRHGRSRERLAEKMHATRQAVSCWETGETVTSIMKSPDGTQPFQIGADRPSLFYRTAQAPTPVFRQNECAWGCDSARPPPVWSYRSLQMKNVGVRPRTPTF